MATENVGNVDVVGRMDDKTTILYLATNAQERQEPDTRFDDNLLIVLYQQKTRKKLAKLKTRNDSIRCYKALPRHR